MRVPGLIDVLSVDSPEAVRALAADERLDRDFGRAGPVLNRMLAGHVRATLAHDGVTLPPASPRRAPGRAAARDALEARLATATVDPAHLDALASYVGRANDARLVGPLVQEVVGRLFAPGYAATEETWQAALLLARAVRSRNPILYALWWLNGRLALACSRLADACGGDLTGLHATGIAVHNLVAATERMRARASQPGMLASTTPEQAAMIALAAPPQVLREATAHGTTPHGTFRRGTLVVLKVEAARARTLSADTAFLAATWSRCPSHNFVPRLLAQVWRRAQEMAQ